MFITVNFKHEHIAQHANWETALEYALKCENASYVVRDSDGLVIARKIMDVNPVFKKEISF